MMIAVSGSTGVGKSSFAKSLCDRFGWQLVPEPIDQNPILPLSLEDPEKWAYTLQVYFLMQRFRAEFEASNSNEVIVMDRIMEEGREVFLRAYHELGILNDDQVAQYLTMYENLSAISKKPALLIYLDGSADFLMKNIQNRGREFEKALSHRRMDTMAKYYSSWFQNYQKSPKMRIDSKKWMDASESNYREAVFAEILSHQKPI